MINFTRVKKEEWKEFEISEQEETRYMQFQVEVSSFTDTIKQRFKGSITEEFQFFEI
jgi:hypothetical protein